MAVVVYYENFLIGLPRLLGSAVAIAVFVAIAYKIPARAISPRSLLPMKKPRVMAVLGIVFFPIILFGESIGKAFNVPILLSLAIVLGFEGLVLMAVLRWIGATNNHRHVVALAAGLTIPIGVFGFFVEFTFPVVLVVDLLFVLFMLRLWKTANQTRPPDLTLS